MAKNPGTDWHALTPQQVLELLKTNKDRGLSNDEALARTKDLGPNSLPKAKSVSSFELFIRQLKSPLIYLLLAAAAIALFLQEWNDAIIIATVVLINAVIGALQEGRAKRSLEALRRFNLISSHVIRDSRDQKIDAVDLVPGDIIKIGSGDAIPADARLIEAKSFQTAEAQLTGESIPIAKDTERLAPDARVSARTNMVYAGTYAVAGRALAVIVATGLQTELGKIAELTESSMEEETPLDKKIARFGRYVLVIAGIVLFSMISVGLLRGIPIGEIFIIAISQIVGLIPEGLPIAVTVAHAIAVQRMAHRRALTRRISAIETLGSVNVICTDKTGTLTQNEMTVTTLKLYKNRSIHVTGIGYEPKGEFFENGRKIDPLQDPQLTQLLTTAILCNDAKLMAGADDHNRWHAVGDPTEVALLTLAQKAGLDPQKIHNHNKRLRELPFESAIKMMATEHEFEGRTMVALKGAPEAILDLCTKTITKDGFIDLHATEKTELHLMVESMAFHALRVIAVALVENGTIVANHGFDLFRGNAIFLGFVGQIDPPRREAKEAIERCKAAGIRPVMLTGDHKITGHAIAQELGMKGDALDGEELEKMHNDVLRQRIDDFSVFARVLPAQKLRIINAYKDRHEVVAMTGDGVNDAPALVRADVGVAMGASGTEVAKEAAKIVITDDNFATIVTAIEHGRVVYQNIQKAILLLISTAAAETLILFLAIALGYPPPFTAVQILWINLVTETAIVINLVMDPPEGSEMRMPPIDPHVSLVPGPLLMRIAFMTAIIFLCTLGWFIYRIHDGIPTIQAQTEAFTMLVICDWFNVLNCRSKLKSALSMGIFKNPWLVGGLILGILLQVAVIYWPFLGNLFHTEPIDLKTVGIISAIASLVLVGEEIRKFFARRAKSTL